MSVTRYEVRKGAYYDSVVLMQLQKALLELPGVADAGVVMATPANRDLMAAAGFALEDVAAAADDLLLAVRADSAPAAAAALAQVDALLKRRQSDGAADNYRPKSLATAVAQAPDAQWVLISVPGRYAAGVAEQALRLNRHVFLYSDNVALDDEVRLKRLARARGRLLMGPDCGTAIVNGIGLGFANRVRRGSIGLIAASGTGLQAVASAIDALGGGISQALGTGGRDLKDAVGGSTALDALALLAADPQTDCIVLISKPPSPTVAAHLLGAARAVGKPVIVNLIGYASPARRLGNLLFANGLRDAAELAVAHAGRSTVSLPAAPDLRPRDGQFIRGLFAGGTLAVEAVLTLQAFFAPLYSNVPSGAALPLADPLRSTAHTIVDLGEDVFTQGRLHPMLDNALRLRRLREEAADPTVGALLLDVVLGEGAHPNPAAELAPAIAAAKRERDLTVVAVVVGTDADPQDRAQQIAQLQAAGAELFTDLLSALDALIGTPFAAPGGTVAPLAAGMSAINVGLESFHDSLVDQGAQALHVEWRPPAGGNERLIGLLARLKQGGD